MVQAVCCVLVGHGLSEGERAMVSEFNTYCKDVIQHVNIIRNKHPNIPIFILGHSMVSLVSQPQIHYTSFPTH